ncbi:uncharacterized protein LOC125782478 [Astyanax mexicanus]|uniref:uncharacterized protein LOC125782478 n=1 Tax=Astyanax mexicanus TaxID=7994 RepID=UPI0020CB6499|nr:uncharacterized protein LOC125782478 [Astyanax mexicanus]
MASLSPSERDEKLGRLCSCGNNISARDTHPCCNECLGLQHAQDALAPTGSCIHCARLPMKSLRRRLARHASLTDRDPMMAAPPAPEGQPQVSAASTSANWAEHMDEVSPLLDELGCMREERDELLDAELDSLDGSDNILPYEDDDDPFLPPTEAAMPQAPRECSSGAEGEVGGSPAAGASLHDVCKRAAGKLGIPWPSALPEKAGSRYEGKRLPRVKSMERQVLPLFPECLEEMTRTWPKPFSSKNPVLGGATLDCAEMEANGLSNLPQVEPLVAHHLHPGQKAFMTTSAPSFPSKADGFQSSMTDKAYRSVALGVRALNASSMLMAYQAELQEEMAGTTEHKLWDEMCVVTDLCLRLHRCAVQASGRAMSIMVTQERARWLNLSSLSHREKVQLLDVAVDPKGLFGPAMAAMQRRCEEKKREGFQSDPPHHSPDHQQNPKLRVEEHGVTSQLHQWTSTEADKRRLAPAWARGPRRQPNSLPGEGKRVCQTHAPLPLGDQSLEPAVAAHSSEVWDFVQFRKPLSTVKNTLCSTTIKLYPIVQPGHGPRALQNKNALLLKNIRNTVHLAAQGHISSVPEPAARACAAARARQCCPPLVALQPAVTQRIARWRACIASQWVLRTVEKGYRLQFSHTPPRFSDIIWSQARGNAASFLEAEIASLLEKGAIQVVPPTQSRSGFYSRYFIVPKKGGGMRPILDLRALNKHLRQYKFRMLTHSALLKFVRPDDWFTTIDLKDAYFHIPIYPPHRKFLRFAFQGRTYEYMVLPFGLSLSPRVFVKCTEAAIGPLRANGIRLATYLDDWLLAAKSKEEAVTHTEYLMRHLSWLGFQINLAKSVLNPSQSVTFIGLSLDSVAMRARLSPDRVEAFQACLAQFRRGNYVELRMCYRLLGLMASALAAIPLGRLHMRGFQRWVAKLGLDPRMYARRKIIVSAQRARTLRLWKHPRFLSQGAPLGTISARKVITTDASLWGWGATHEGRSVNGQWSPSLRLAHVNVLELRAVCLALRHFLPYVENSHVLVRTDNTTVVAYINKQGGLRSLQLHRLAHRLIIWSNANLLSLRATHVPGVSNRGADLLSRGHPRYGEWKLHPDVVNMVWKRYGLPAVDLFASRENAQCHQFFSLKDRDAPLGVDALAHEWPRALLYAFPPLALISPTLIRVREAGLSVILIAPNWPQKTWLAEITQMLYAQPWPLPLRRDLLSQARGEIFHPHPERLALWAWPVKG